MSSSPNLCHHLYLWSSIKPTGLPSVSMAVCMNLMSTRLKVDCSPRGGGEVGGGGCWRRQRKTSCWKYKSKYNSLTHHHMYNGIISIFNYFMSYSAVLANPNPNPLKMKIHKTDQEPISARVKFLTLCSYKSCHSWRQSGHRTLNVETVQQFSKPEM